MAESAGLSNVAVTFDLWQTLIFEDGGSPVSGVRRHARTGHTVRILKQHGVAVSTDTVWDGFTALSHEITSGHDSGYDNSYEDWIRLLVNRLAPGLIDRVGSSLVDEIGQNVDGTFLESPPSLLQGSSDVLALLRDRGIKVGLISNTGLTSPQMYHRWFEQQGILDKFDFLAFSNELSVAKPDRAIFDTTLAELSVEPGKALHVGDNLHTDVGGAAAVGMSTVWVRGGISSPVETNVDPDFEVDSVVELPGIVDEWLSSLRR